MKKILCNLIVLSLLLCSCGKKESLVNNVGAKEKEVKKSEIVESKKNEIVESKKSEIVESDEIVKLKLELKEIQEELERERARLNKLNQSEAKQGNNYFVLLAAIGATGVVTALVAVLVNKHQRVRCLLKQLNEITHAHKYRLERYNRACAAISDLNKRVSFLDGQKKHLEGRLKYVFLQLLLKYGRQ